MSDKSVNFEYKNQCYNNWSDLKNDMFAQMIKYSKIIKCF